MELLVKIALIIAIVIAVTLFVVGMILFVSSFFLISDIDTYENLESNPETFLQVINTVHSYQISYLLENTNSNYIAPSTEMWYCKVLGGQFEIVPRSGDIEISTCLLKYQFLQTWSDIWNYIPDDNRPPFELECVQLEGIPIHAPKPLGETIPLCLIDV